MDKYWVRIDRMPEEIIKKYRPLRKMRTRLSFTGLYHPYFFISLRGDMSNFFIKNRSFFEQRAVNAITSVVYAVFGTPEFDDQSACHEKKAFHLLEPEIDMDTAVALARENVVNNLTRKYGGPLRPKLTLTVEILDGKEIYKPFWVLHNGTDTDEDMVMVVDAVTGMAGIPESLSIKRAWSKTRRIHVEKRD